MERPPFAVSVDHVYRIVFGLPSEVDGRLFTLGKRPRACCQARTGKVGRTDSVHHAANVGDPEIGLREVGYANALVLRRKSLEGDVLELTARRSLWRVARIEAFAASIELIQEFVGVLARTHSRGVHFGVLRSKRFPRTAIDLFAKDGPLALSVF